MQPNRVEYLKACGEARRLSEEARKTKWEEFLADLEGNPNPARACNIIKSLSGSPHSTAFTKPLIHSDRTLPRRSWRWRKDQLMQVYKPLQLSLLTYAALAWQPWASPSLIEQRERCQNKALRVVTGQLKSTPVETLR